MTVVVVVMRIVLVEVDRWEVVLSPPPPLPPPPPPPPPLDPPPALPIPPIDMHPGWYPAEHCPFSPKGIHPVGIELPEPPEPPEPPVVGVTVVVRVV